MEQKQKTVPGTIIDGNFLAAILLMFWHGLKEKGYDQDAIFTRNKINPADLRNTETRIDVPTRNRLFADILKTTGDPCFLLKTMEHWHPSNIGALGYSWLVSSSLRDAFARADRYIQTVTSTREFYFNEDRDSFSIVVDTDKPGDIELHVPELILAILLHMVRVSLHRSFCPTKITLATDNPECIYYFKDTLNCPVVEQSDKTSLILPIDVIDEPLTYGNQDLAKLTDQSLITYLAKFDKENVINQVKSKLLALLSSGNYSEEKVAGELNMSTSKLQRVLAEKETSYRQLLLEVRQSLAERYLLDLNLSLTEVAFLLGYSEAGSFSRAYKQWTGQSPSAARASL